MTRIEQLRENYEDALFALLLTEMSQQEGEKLWEENEKLNDDPEFQVPEETDRHCLAAIRKAAARVRRKKAARVTKKVMVRLAVAVLIMNLLFASAFAAIPQVRERTLDLLIRVTDVSTELHMDNGDYKDEQEEGGAVVQIMGYSIPEMPEGFELVYQDTTEADVTLRYENSDREAIDISFTRAPIGSFSMDTEDADAKRTRVNNFDAFTIEKNGQLRLVLVDTSKSNYISISSSFVSADELIALAEKIK